MEIALERKKRSEAICKSEGVPFTEHLPVIEDESTANIRTAEEIAWRAMALCLVALKGEGLEQDEVMRTLKEYRLEQALTPDERRFIFDETPSQQDKTNFTWKYECYWVMLWAVGYIEELDRPDHICDVPKAVQIMVNRNADEFVQGAIRRSPTEILDEADLIYRYHWAVVDARLKGRKAPANLDAGVVYERHYALNWLIGYGGQSWDDISTDT